MNDTYSNYSLFEQTYSNVSKPSNNTLKKQMIAQIFFMIVHQSVIMAVSLLGNLFLLFVIFRGNRVMKRRVSPVQLLILHTCVADLLFVFLSLGTEILTLMAFPNYYGSNFTCKFMRYVQMFPMYASPFLLVAISADRYQAICRPLAHFRSSRYRRPNWMAAIAWGLALLLSVPQFFVWTKNGKTGRCSTVYGVNRNIIKSVYVIMFNTLAWLLPSIFAAFFYYCVCKAVRLSSNKSVRAMDSQKKNGKQSTEATENYIEELRKKSKGFRQQMSEFDRKRVQTVRLTITIVACNFFLWMPFCIINVIQALWPDVLSPAFINNVSVLGNLNSCLNPWIYILFNRSHVKKALCQSRGTSEPTTKRSLVNFDTSTATNNNNNNHNSTQSNSLNHHCNHRSNFKYKKVHQRSHSTDCTSFR